MGILLVAEYVCSSINSETGEITTECVKGPTGPLRDRLELKVH